MNENNKGTHQPIIDRTTTPPAGELSEDKCYRQPVEHFHPDNMKEEISECIKQKVWDLNQLIRIADKEGMIVTLSGNGTIPGQLQSQHGHMALKVKVQKITEY